MTSDNAAPDELPPAEQPPTDDPWVVVTPMPLAKQPVAPTDPASRRKAFPCAKCGAYWPCEHDDAASN
jgi:hypothetical protein